MFSMVPLLPAIFGCGQGQRSRSRKQNAEIVFFGRNSVALLQGRVQQLTGRLVMHRPPPIGRPFSALVVTLWTCYRAL